MSGQCKTLKHPHLEVPQDLGVHLRDVESVLGRCTFEMLKVCLEDAETLHLLFRAAEDLARAEAPEPITRAFMSATMTALLKHDGGVRGIATGTSFRRLVAKTMARQFGKAVEAVCAPFQFALSTRAGTDCVGHAVRAMTDANPECTVLSIDGVGAYDHVLRSSFLSKLHSVPSLQGLLPFVRSIYAQTTTYVWEDGTGVRHRIQQAEGGEQGDPLMPLLFSLGIHDSLCEVRNRLRPDDTLFAYLDDVYVSSPPNRTREGYNLLEHQLLAGAGIQLHTGKTRVWNRAGDMPPGSGRFGRRTSGAQMAPRSWARRLVRLSLCTASLKGDWKMRGDSWEAVTWVPDLQSAWQILLQCAGPRCHRFAHCPRVIPQNMLPATTTACGRPRGRFWEDLTGTEEDQVTARHLATLPMRLGGLGLRSAARMAPASYWASWADALPMIHERLPQVARNVVDRLDDVQEIGGCIRELHDVTVELDRQGFVGRACLGRVGIGSSATSRKRH